MNQRITDRDDDEVMRVGDLRLLPFRGSMAVGAGVAKWSQLRGPHWRRLLPDVYVAADVDLDHRMWCRAALAYAGSPSAISGLSAARLWGALVGGLDDQIEITVPARRVLRPRTDRLRIVRSHLAAAEYDSVGGLALTSPLRTLLDLAKRGTRDDCVIAVETLLRRGLVSSAALEHAGHEWSGTRTGRIITNVASLASTKSESPMETRARLVMLDGGLPMPTVQLEVFDTHGRFVARLDLAYEDWKIGIEYEGDHHRERGAFQNDLARLNKLTALGWVIVRVGPRDIYRDPERLVQQLKDLINQRSRWST